MRQDTHAQPGRVRYGVTLATILFAQFFCGPAQAHPHVWVDYSVVIQGNGTFVHALKEQWVFAKSFPVAVVIDPASMPKSGPLDAKSTAVFKAQAFNSLKSTNYFTHLYVDGKPTRFGEPRHFAVAIENDKVVYTFVLPLAKPVDLIRHVVEMGVWDESFFVDYQPVASSPVVFAPEMAALCNAQAYRDQDHPIFGGMVFPTGAKLACAASK